MRVCVYVCGIEASRSPYKAPIEKACKIHTHICTFQSFFPTDMGVASFKQGLPEAPSKASVNPLIKPLQSSSREGPMPHTYTHFGLFSYRFKGCFTIVGAL